MSRGSTFLFLVLGLAAATSAVAQRPGELDWSTWREVPVFHDGRIMPLDTFARLTVDKICGKASAMEKIRGRAHPELGLEGALLSSGAEPPGFAETRKLFPDGRRRFTSAELLFSWLVEPQRWESVPFLVAEYEPLRQRLLGLPVFDKDGHRLKYVSPRQVQDSHRFWMHLTDLSRKQNRAGARGEKFVPSAVDEKANELYEALALYRMITFNPTAAGDGRDRFHRKLGDAIHTWKRLEPNLSTLRESSTSESDLLAAVDEAIDKLIALSGEDELPLGTVEPVVVSLKESAAGLAERFAGYKERLFAGAPSDMPAEQVDRLRRTMHELASVTADLARQANEAHLALYDNGYSLRLVPGLNPAALDNTRAPADDAQPWTNLQTLLVGSDEVLRGYPSGRVAAVRTTFRKVADVYVDRRLPGRPQRFAAAMDGFAAAVRRLADEIEPLREKLPIRQRDEALIALTAYPPPGATRAEVHYYRLDPFFWSWLISLGAMACFGLSFGALRKGMFWLGVLALLGAQLFTIYGMGLRVYITGWAPVTNMFETIVFVALVVALLGLWFVFYPMFGTGLQNAWRMTAVPRRFETRRSTGQQTAPADTSWRTGARWLLQVPRVAIAALVFAMLAVVRYGSGEGYTAVSLLPRTAVGATVPTVNDLVVWAVGMCVLLLAVWLASRVALTLLLGTVMIPKALAGQALSELLERTAARKPLALVAAGVACFAALVAYYAPVSGKHISALMMPVLRDNFWLTVHVLSITASYGAAALAWGLGNIALGYYLLGSYRDAAGTSAAAGVEGGGRSEPSGAAARRPARRRPAACAPLGTFVYKAMQVTVLLLTVGTVLGALWGDVSWGRFWSWDPKEVWALLSLLIYLDVMHARTAGLLGNFGLAVGSVLGATSILMAWYGVNYILGSGLHAYTEGNGGARYVLGILALNWAFVVAASIRYVAETRAPAAQPSPG